VAIADKIMLKVETLETAFYLRYSYTYRLRNIENGKVMLFHKNLGAVQYLLPTWMLRESGYRKKDESRLNTDKIERPNTKWSFARWLQIEVKAVLTKQPMLGHGQLPDWLRNNMGIYMYALDGYNDNLCLFCCLAVHRGARPDRCTEKKQNSWLENSTSTMRA